YAFLMLPLGYLALPGVFPAWVWAGATLLQITVVTLVVTAIAAAVVQRMRSGGAPGHGSPH
ncbi:MAG: hypothetical protein H7345_13735, partial [Rubritepida sp.]|nr:hypothetical protein [Rubritepida sp.]